MAVALPASAWAEAPTGIVTADPPTQERSGNERIAAPPPAPRGVTIDRPTVSIDAYLAAKRAAGSAGLAGNRAGLGVVQQSIASVYGFNGDTEGGPGGGGAPPDINGAVGVTQHAEVTNSDLTVYKKTVPAPGLPLANVGLNAIAGYSATQLFDPRILYDALWKRWVIEAEGFPETTTTQYQFILSRPRAARRGPGSSTS